MKGGEHDLSNMIDGHFLEAGPSKGFVYCFDIPKTKSGILQESLKKSKRLISCIGPCEKLRDK